jgi:hypothetical protein
MDNTTSDNGASSLQTTPIASPSNHATATAGSSSNATSTTTTHTPTIDHVAATENTHTENRDATAGTPLPGSPPPPVASSSPPPIPAGEEHTEKEPFIEDRGLWVVKDPPNAKIEYGTQSLISVH